MADERQTDPTPPADDRRFGYWAGHFVVVGSMVGSGILFTSGGLLRDTGNPGAVLGLWVLGGALALCGALCVAELATALPKSGGDYVFVRAAFGRGAGFVSGWATFTLGFAAPTAIAARFAFESFTRLYASELAAALPPWVAGHAAELAASGLILAVGVIHSLGHRHSSWLQTFATLFTAAVLLVIAGGGLAFGRGDWNHLSATTWPSGTQWPALVNTSVRVSSS